MNKTLFVAAGFIAVITVTVYIVFFSSSSSSDLRPPDELARVALQGNDVREKEQAALDLERGGEAARPHLRNLLAESQDAEVRAAAIRGLQALKDWHSMPRLLDGLSDKSEHIRIVSYGAVSDLLGSTYNYKPNDPPEQRARAIKSIRKAYDIMNKNPPSHYRSAP